MEKQELINQLEHIHLNFDFGLACLSLINDPIAIKALPQLSINFGSYKHNHDKILSLLKDKNNKSVPINNFFKRNIMCSILKDYYDSVLYYCNQTTPKQVKKFQEHSFYQYSRIIRNAMSHGYKFNFSQMKDKTVFPIKWNGKTIYLSDENKEITEDKLNFQDVFALLGEFENFVKTKLQ